ncbi:MAG: inorganic triphosphatase [Candidatus Accumulibacter sp.]|nr:inorganic triphosphatase [Accumulibacter sp.]
MALETEIKLSLPPRAAGKLAGHPLLAGVPALRQRLLNTYYDTPDLRLQRERVAVRYRRKGRDWLLTVKCAAPAVGGLAQRNEWEVPARPGEFDFSHVDDAKLRALLEELRPQLTPAFTTDFTRSAWIIEPRPGVRIELALDRGHIEAAGRRAPICEVELELLAGDVADLFAAAAALQRDLPLHPEAPSKAERGYRLFADTPLRPFKAQATLLHKRTPPLAAFRAAALGCLAQLQGNEAGVRDSDAPEFIHQARVAIRRLRSALRVWRPLLPKDFAATFDPRWRALAARLGEARNWDVFLGETLPPLADTFPAHPDLPLLRKHAEQRRSVARKAARAALAKGGTYSQLLLDFTAATVALPDGPPKSLKALARRALGKRAARADQLARRIAASAASPGDDAAARHRLRVALKRLRYALEFFAALYPARRLSAYQRTLAALLDTLGRMNDLMVAGDIASATLAGYRGELAQGWLAGRHQFLQGELNAQLTTFLDQSPPWKRG